MLGRSSTAMIAIALVSALMSPTGGARAADAKYPNWEGEWDYINPRFGGQGVKYDPTKAFGPAQQAPLTPEYQKIHEESMADQAKGGQGNFIDHARCIPGGMPSTMSATRMEYIVTPKTTYISAGGELRRIFTDGRPWPTDVVATYQGYAIDGSTRTATASTTCSSRDTRSHFKARAPTMPPGCAALRRDRPSRSGSISTRTIRTSCMTRSPPSIMP